MKLASLDTETTTRDKGSPFVRSNKFIVGGFYDGSSYFLFTEEDTQAVQEYIDDVDCLLLFNGKFDLHWLRRIGVKVPLNKRVWDCQLGEFILSNQAWRFPSLDEASEKRLGKQKIDVIKEKYWSQGIDTDQIPREELDEYLKRDLELHYELALAQRKEFATCPKKYNLFKVGCADLMILEEMEWNGVKYDAAESRKRAVETAEELEKLDRDILGEYHGLDINLNSTNQRSCLLYGGDIVLEYRVPVGHYKSGQKVGQVRYAIQKRTVSLPRLVEPLQGTALASEGVFSTEADVLKKLRPQDKRGKAVIAGLQARAKLEKLRSTYLEGLPTRIEDSDWEPGYLFGQYNQCVVITGRLSSSKPNLQNLDKMAKQLCVSRYD